MPKLTSRWKIYFWGLRKMNRFRALLKILLISNLGISAIRAKAKRSKIEYLKIIGLAAAITAGIAPSIWLYCRLLIQGFDLLAPAGQESAILTLGIVMVCSIIFFFGVFYVINIFYFSADAQSLLSLPLTGWQVLGARFSVAIVYEYLTEFVFLLPPILVYGIKSQAPVLFWLYALIGFLFVPLLPLGLAAIATVIIMRFANLGRRKDLFKILGGFAIIALAIGYQFLVQKSGANMMDPVFIQNLLSDRNGLMFFISRLFPSARYLGLALVNASNTTGLLNLCLFMLISVFTVALTWLIGEKLYFKGLIGSSEKTVRRKELTGTDYKRFGQGSSALLSYFKKEVLLLIRTPIYLLNCVLTNLLVPVILIIPVLLQRQNETGPMPWEAWAANPTGQIILMAVIVGASIFLTGSNGITSTSISREGSGFYLSKFIPLPYQKQIQAKLLSGLIFGIMGVILLLIAAYYIMALATTLLAIILAVSLVAIIPVIEAGLLIDILHPKLDWDNEQKAVKQNLNVIISMIFSILLGGTVLFIAVRFIQNFNLAAAFMLVCFGIAGAFLYYLLMSKGINKYGELEG
jgi:ABC-2 type transport system permease protein